MNNPEALKTSDWWRIARQSSQATFFHSPLWHYLILTTFPEFSDATISGQLANGFDAVLPLLETRAKMRGLLKNYTSTFAGCYGGIISTNEISLGDRKSFIQPIVDRAQFGQMYISGNPLFAQPVADTTDFTQMLNLTSGFDEIWKNYSSSNRSNIRKGIRMGLAVRVATSKDEYERYYKNAYQNSIKRWGSAARRQYTWALFRNGFTLGKVYPKNMKLWIVELNGEVLAGAWVFYWNSHVVCWQATAHRNAFPYRPYNVLHNEIIRDACTSNYQCYDFNPSAGLAGVVRFKQSFGARKFYLHPETIVNPAYQFYLHTRQRIQNFRQA